MNSPRIAVVGTTRAGKSVFITVLAKYLERPRDGARLSPRAGSPKNTYAQIEEWWNELQSGTWLPPTTPGTLIELNWDLVVDGKTIPLQMFDYAGETLTDLFNSAARNAEGAAKQYFDKVRSAFDSASVLLVLLNLESLIEQGVGRATETKATLITAMTAFLEKIKADKRDCRVCFVFTSYDRYESVIRERWGNVRSFLEQEIPPLYYEFAADHPKVRILPVAAVSETELRIEPTSGVATLFPKPGFKSRGFDEIVEWLVHATRESKADLDDQAEATRQDLENERFAERVVESWQHVPRQRNRLEDFIAKALGPFPHPHRPNVEELATQFEALVYEADSQLEQLRQEERAAFWQRVASAMRSVALVFFSLIAGLMIIAYLSGDSPGPAPQLIPGSDWNWRWDCRASVIGCWGQYHHATANVPIRNNGGAGNIAVILTIGKFTKTETCYFNQGEQKWVSVTLNDLPDHNTQAYITFRAEN